VTDRLRRIVGYGSALAGATLLMWAVSITLLGWLWQAGQAPLLTLEGAAAGARVVPGSESPPVGPPRHGTPVARLRVARLGIEAVVVEGTDPGSLLLGPGHLEGSALPGEPDNCIIAGHRDGSFGRLRSVRQGDVVELATGAGRTARYSVRSVEIVDKDDTRALARTDGPLLTLVTCYPFHYIGRAPRRFIVRAVLLGDQGKGVGSQL
jgi:sortase A